MIHKQHPLGLPEGSVRAIIALMLVAGALVYMGLGIAVEPILGLVAGVVGFYFGKGVQK